MKKFTPRKSDRTPRIAIITAAAILVLLTVVTSVFNVVHYAWGRFADGFFYPYLLAVQPSDRLSDTTLLMQDKSSLAIRLEKLANINRSLALQSQAAAGLMEENRQLRNLLKLTGYRGFKFITAEILLRDPLRFREGFTIGKGSRDGVVPGAAVVEVNSAGSLLLVGVVSEVGARSSKVVTVVNNSLRISGRVSSNKEIGFTNSGEKSSSGERIVFGMLPVRGDYIHGNMVSTTGFEFGIPEGIKIGELYTNGNFNFYNQEDYFCELIPAVRFESLRFVGIALPETPEAIQ